MDRTHLQQRIDAIQWYHDFDFGDGLAARAEASSVGHHREMWAFTRQQLDRIDFRGKTVLDLGCWDGYWSFYAEKRGAKNVLASDDATQNWAGSAGLHLAKELLGSRIETRLDLNVYELASLKRKFDIVLCLGVYYHLHAPFHAFAQIRHCCHPGTVVVFEGNESLSLPQRCIWADLTHPGTKYTPTNEALSQQLQAAYFQVESEARFGATDWVPPLRPRSWRWRLAACWRALRGQAYEVRRLLGHVIPEALEYNRRVLKVCRPFEGENDLHVLRPPFGLHEYDTRWKRAAA